MTRLGAVVLVTITYAAALWLRGSYGVWVTTGVAGTVAILAVVAVDGPRLRAALRPSWRIVAWGVGLGVAMAAATHAAHALAVAWWPELRPQVAALYAELAESPGPVAALPVLATVIVGEELTWRGTLVHALFDRGWSRGAVLVAASLAYPLPHLLGGGPWLLPVVAFGCGLLWTAERLFLASLLACTLTHVVWDVIVFVLLPLA
ncbi:MAG: CPBP family intramembrane glutamic endopeptidase [Myxococcota bacterium]